MSKILPPHLSHISDDTIIVKEGIITSFRCVHATPDNHLKTQERMVDSSDISIQELEAKAEQF